MRFALPLWLAISILGSSTFAQEQDQAPIFYPEAGPFYFANNYVGRGLAKVGPLKIVSYNLNFARQPDAVAKELATLPALAGADIILLQEITGPLGGAGNAAELIAKQLHMNYVFAPAMVHEGLDYGNAILSRFKLHHFRKYNLPISSAEPKLQRDAVEADVYVGLRKVKVISVHLSVKFRDVAGSDSSRSKQMESVLARIHQDEWSRTIIGGDFNSYSPKGNRKLFAMLGNYRFKPATLNKDWTMRYLHFRLDHVYAHGEFVHVSDGVDYGAKASDHVPIWTLIDFPNR